MSEADRLFNKLGYKKYTSEDCIMFMKDLFIITFILQNKTFITEYKQGDYNFPKIRPFEIGKEELEAITLEFVELRLDRRRNKTMLSEEEKKAIENIKAIVTPSETVKVEKVTMYKECIEDIIRIINLIKKQSDEIEKEKTYNEFYIDLCNNQQKEIQHLKEYKHMYENLCK